MAEKKEKKTASPIEELEAKYGKGTIQSFNEESTFDRVGSISTGSPRLDRAIGIGGIPVGRITEIVGPESSGKTTVATHILKEAQKRDTRRNLILDVEQTFDFLYAQKIGLDPTRVDFSQPSHGEMAFEIAKSLIKTGNYSAVVLDSIAASIPKEQHEGETGQSRLARLAALLSMELPKFLPIINKNDCALILLNQFRNNIGGYGNPEKAAGGEALKYYASVRIDLRKTAEPVNGRNETRAKVFKNKCAPPFGEATFYIDWGVGINRTLDIFNDAIDLKVIDLAGSWYTLWKDTPRQVKAQGEDAMMQLFIDNPELLIALEAEVVSKLKE
jgi:recombination protein RecA